MSEASMNLYIKGMTPRELAEKVLEDTFGQEMPPIPIDPYKMMRIYGIVYQLRDFKRLEGIYLVPENDDDIPIVGINYNRKITRRRFTAAHELCHHLKDREDEACPIGQHKNETEQYAEQFAAELLMPKKLFLAVVGKYEKGGYVTMDDALLIAQHFGVSFKSCVIRLAYTFHKLDGEYDNLRRRIEKYKPDKKKAILGIQTEDINLVRQEVDSYEFFFSVQADIIWHRFKEDFIFNENRMEGVDLGEEQVAEIVTDLRLNHQNSAYCKEGYEDIIQITGHAELYDYILSTDEKPTIYKLLALHKKLFQYAPFPEEAGTTRKENNLVLGAKFETDDWQDIVSDLQKLQQPVDELIRKADELSISEYVLRSLKIHHRITQIHPFRDGNGRTSRALLNWMLREKGLPAIYFKAAEKEAYFEALKIADTKGDYDELLRLTIRELFRTIMTVGKR